MSDAVASLELRFVVPGPPVPKARARVVSRGKGQRAHGFTPGKTEAYENHVAVVALGARLRAKSWPRDRLYAVGIAVHRSAARGDWDNFAKAICDACNGVLWTDDARVRAAFVELHTVAKGNERAEVRVWVLEDMS